MEELQVSARFKIHDGKLDAFKAAAEKCLQSVREKDTATLQYDWFFSEDQTECVVRERYSSSETLLQHIVNLGDIFQELLAAGDFSVELFGRPSAELLKTIECADLAVFSHFRSA